MILMVSACVGGGGGGGVRSVCVCVWGEVGDGMGGKWCVCVGGGGRGGGGM